ncbi:MAG: MBL fold metallo-hydrolase, partial [Selenomonadaceae bacterium]|nr:MBL fold metallo-hydrolase [Selenomonadaceae bacterium]
MELTYLLNSGFMVRDEKILVVFDDYEDPANAVDIAYDQNDFDRLYVLVTHAHFDHFGTRIRAYAPKTTRYIFSSDIKHTKRVKIFPTNKITYIKRYSNWQDDMIKVTSFDSTDVGISFMVEFPSGRKVFHAGDFNWWHWVDDTRENLDLAEKIFKRQLKRLDGLEVDAAFFPIDGRLGASQEMGAIEFVQRTKSKVFVAMHREEFPKWEPSPAFVQLSRNLPTWSPVTPGEKITV